MRLAISLSHKQEAGDRGRAVNVLSNTVPFFCSSNATRRDLEVKLVAHKHPRPSHLIFQATACYPFSSVDMVPMGHNGDDCCLGESDMSVSLLCFAIFFLMDLWLC